MITLKQLDDEIRLIAYQLYELRGKEPGHEVEDWLEAEKIVMGKYLKSEGKLEDKSAEAQLRRAEAGLAAEGTSVVTLAETSAMAGAEVEAEKAAEAAESEQKKVEQPTGQKKPRSASGGRRRGSTGKKSAE